ncbi:MAG TPA: hypothetical protein VJ551_04520 [Nitrososphaeraceae archaeon]|nr:hypothetical protein [Nitrososphaeraceae archaeon]
MTLLLVSYPDPLEEKEWLIVKQGETNEKDNSNHSLEQYIDTTREASILELNDDLRIWLGIHEEQIKKGDKDIFLKYPHQRRLLATLKSGSVARNIWYIIIRDNLLRIPDLLSMVFYYCGYDYILRFTVIPG